MSYSAVFVGSIIFKPGLSDKIRRQIIKDLKDFFGIVSGTGDCAQIREGYGYADVDFAVVRWSTNIDECDIKAFIEKWKDKALFDITIYYLDNGVQIKNEDSKNVEIVHLD